MQKELLLDESRGIYIPQQFAIHYRDNILQENNERYVEVLENIAIVRQGPDHEEYDDAWTEILTHAKVTLNGTSYTLDQDGDLWAIPEGYEETED